MNQDYQQLTPEQTEQIEKQTLRVIVQAVQEYSREARQIFENTQAPRESEIIVLAEDLVQYALEVAECYQLTSDSLDLSTINACGGFQRHLGFFRKSCLLTRRHQRKTTAKRFNSRSSQWMQISYLMGFPCIWLPGFRHVRDHREWNKPSQLYTSAFIHFFYEVRTRRTSRKTPTSFSTYSSRESSKPICKSCS